MTARILVVEDEPAMQQVLADVLAAKGHAPEVVGRGDDGLRRALEGDHDLLLLDLMLPGASGFDLLRAVRAAGRRTPVIMISARGAEVDKVLGFELGVDDYVTKPFSVLELLGRVGAVLRRAAPEAPAGVLTLGLASFDLKRYVATREGRPLELPARAFDVLRALAARQGEVVSRDALIDMVWGADEVITERTVTNLVVKIRQAIEADPAVPRHLLTVHGVGYRLAM